MPNENFKHRRWIISRAIYPAVILKRAPTVDELEELRRFIIRFKDDHPYAETCEVRQAVQNEFNKKYLLRKPHGKGWKTLNTSDV